MLKSMFYSDKVILCGFDEPFHLLNIISALKHLKVYHYNKLYGQVSR